MQSVTRRLSIGLASLVFLAGHAAAGEVLLLGGGDPAWDATLASVLTSHGHSATIGPNYWEFYGEGLSGYDTVVLVPNSYWGLEMPYEGQYDLLWHVRDGGGLVTGEWTIWAMGGGSFTVLAPAMAVFPTTEYRYNSETNATTYTEVTHDPILCDGVSASFAFTADNSGGSETYYQARPGATVYYSSNYDGGAGVVGRSYCIGRVLNISTVLGPQALENGNYARLVSNAVAWAAQDSPQCPGDLNCDGTVGQPDLGILLASYDVDQGGDIDLDGDTDQSDLGILLSVYGDACP